MADNTTTYTTLVDVQVKGEGELKNLNETAEQGESNFKSLRAQIRETTVAMQRLEEQGKSSTQEFEALRSKLDDLNDTQDRAKFKAGQFEDQLASLPGPLGQIGQGLKTAGDSAATFGKTLTVSLGIIGLLVAAFFAIKDALGKTKEGQEGLSKAMSAFNSITAPIFALLEKVGMAILPIVTKGFEALGTVMNKVAKFFGVSNEKIKEVHTNLEKNNEVVQKNLEAQKKAIEDAQKKKEEDAKKHKEYLDKKAAADKKAAEVKKQNELAAEKVLTEAYIATLSERDKELYRLGMAQEERLKALKKAGIKDTSAIIEQGRIEQAAINKKYDDEIAKKVEEDRKKKEDEAKKKADDDKKAAEDRFNLDNQLREDSANRMVAELELKRTQGQLSYEEDMKVYENVRALGRQTMEAQMASADALAAYDAQTADNKIRMERAVAETKLAIIGDALGAVADMAGRETVAGKALAVAQATINTYLGATKALATYPPPFGAIAAGVTIAAGMLQVKSILSTKLPSSPRPGGGSTGGGGGSAPSAPSIPTMAAPQVQTTGGQNPSQQIGETLAAANGKAVRAYVVSQDIQSQTALDRRTNRAATFSGS